MLDVITDNIDVWTSVERSKKSGGRGRSKNGGYSAHGINKLRELVLGMALRGLFDKENESLPETIEQDIANARDDYFKKIEKKPKIYKFSRALLDEFSLPHGWAWKRVGELCDLQTGATPSRQKPEYFGGDNRWLVSGDINLGIIEECDGRITDEGLKSSNCKILPVNTVLIALNGQGKTRATVALLKVPAACNQSLVGIIPFNPDILDPLFLLLSLKYRYFEIRDITGQNQRRGLNMGLVSELSILLPPLAKQHRIVAKVEELMALCDLLEQQQTDSNAAHQTLIETLLGTLIESADNKELQENWSRIENHFDTLFTTEHSIDQLKQKILQLAVMGKLVPQDPNDEPAKLKILKVKESRIKAYKQSVENAKNRGIRKPKEPKNLVFWNNKPEFLLTDKNIPLNWVKTYFINLCVLQRGHDLPKTKMIGGDYPVASSGGILGFHNEYKVKGPGVYVGRSGSVGKVHFIESNYWPHNTALFVKDFHGNDERYVYYALQAYGIGELSSSTAVATLNRNKIFELKILIPPADEQKRIVAKIDELVAICDSLKTKIRDAQATQNQLANTIVEQAVT